MPHKALNADLQHLHSLKFDKEMAEVGLFQLFFYTARNLVVLSMAYHMFVNLNYEVWQICFYFCVTQLPFSIAVPFIMPLIGKLGIKHAIASRPAAMLCYWTAIPLLLHENYWWSLLLLLPFVCLRGFCGAMSGMAYDLFLSHHLNKKNRGSSLALLQIAVMASTVLAPIIGGFVTAQFGFAMTTYIGLGFFALSGMVLMLTPDEKFKVPYSIKKFLSDSPSIMPKYFLWAESGRIFFDVVMYIVWPLLLVVAVSNISKIGLLAGLSSGIAMILAYLVGKYLDRQSSSKIAATIRFGAYRSTLLNFLRGIWWEPITLGIIDSVNKINDQTIKVPYDMKVYQWMNAKNTVERTHIRSFWAQNIYLVAFGFVTSMFAIFGSSNWVFIVCFLLSAMSLVLTQQVARLSEK